jgi:hypothetical protein
MIIGKGDIASIINDRKEALFFTSGVSNSNETRDSEFLREIELLNKQDKSKCIFYFSSISVDDAFKVTTNKYLQHKIKMETLIKTNFQNYNIIRIGNILWGNNPNTFLNYIRNRMKKGEPILIKDEYKFVINKEQILLLTDNLPLVGQNTISIFGKMAKVNELI